MRRLKKSYQIKQLKDNLGIVNNKTKTNFENLNTTISSKSKWGYLLIFGGILFALCLFYFLRKKVSHTTNKLEIPQVS